MCFEDGNWASFDSRTWWVFEVYESGNLIIEQDSTGHCAVKTMNLASRRLTVNKTQAHEGMLNDERFEHPTLKEFKFYFPLIYPQLVIMNSPVMNTLEDLARECGEYLETEATPGIGLMFIQFENHSVVLALSQVIAEEREVM